MRDFIRNTMINTGALATVGALNLLLVPILISSYGLAAYGVIVLSRLLLPNVALGLFDLGLPNVATRNIAYHLARKEIEKIAEVVSCALLLALLIGSAVMFAFLALDIEDFAHFFRVEPAQQDGFRMVFLALATALPILFPGVVLQGAIEGWEKFWITRGVEIAVNSFYFAAAVWIVMTDRPFHLVALTFILLQVGKAFVFAAVVAWLVGSQRRNLLRPRLAALRRMVPEMRVLYANKVIDLVNNEAPALLVAQFIGPAGLGMFDALIRIPRFLRMLVNVLKATVMPVAMRLSAGDTARNMHALILAGTRISAFCMMPLVFNGIVYSDDFLGLWLGPDFAKLGIFLSLALVWMMFPGLLGVVTMASVPRLSVLRAINRVGAGEAIIKVSLLLALLPWLGTKAAFIVIAALAAASYLLQLRIVLPAHGIDEFTWRWMVTKIAVASVLTPVVISTLARGLPPGPAWWSAVLIALSTLASYAAVYMAWSPEEREEFGRIVATALSILRLRRPRASGAAE